MLVTKIISLHTFLPKFVRSCLKQNCHIGRRDVFRSAHAPALHALRARENADAPIFALTSNWFELRSDYIVRHFYKRTACFRKSYTDQRGQ